MSDRPAKEITTPGGHVVAIKEYLTAREVNGVLSEIFKSQEISTDEANSGKSRISLLVGIQRNIKLVEAAVLSLDGSGDNLAERLQDLPASEYTFILNQAKGLADGNF
jgi:hypothetical protein